MIRHDQFGAIEDGNMAVPWPSPAVVGDEKNVPVTPSPWCRKRAPCVA